MPETKTCVLCKNPFVIDDEDFAFYEKIAVPPPTLCPDDRQRRRAAFRNERNFYRRKCSATGRDIISMYSPDKPFPVYEQEYWWGDSWNPLDYGQDFDFNRPFFEQFRELQLRVPRVSLFNYNSENSYYTNHSGENKNCYMSADLGGCEDVYHSNWVTYGKNCIDCSYTYSSELCYQTLYCEKCFNCDFCQESENCTDCFYCFDCKGCRNCFGCAGLRNKEFYIFNKPVSKEDFQQFVKIYKYSYLKQKDALRQFSTIRKSVPHRATLIIDSEDCTGNYIYHSKNAKLCFDAVRLWDCKYCYNTLDIKDGYDCYQPGFEAGERVYETHAGNKQFNCKFLTLCKSMIDCEYCDNCFYSHDLFGCIGIKRGQFCILNKQYSENEYRALRLRIIKHMGGAASAQRERHWREPQAEAMPLMRAGRAKEPEPPSDWRLSEAELKNNEYGEFFPLSCSPFGYNESKAQEYYPLTKEEALAYNFNWSDFSVSAPTGETIIPPDDIRKVDNSILEKTITCEKSDKPFKLVKQELDFYRRKHLPIPRKSPEARYRDRMALRRPRKLFNRTCASCGGAIKTTYSPQRPEIVYCEPCYLKEIY